MSDLLLNPEACECYGGPLDRARLERISRIRRGAHPAGSDTAFLLEMLDMVVFEHEGLVLAAGKALDELERIRALRLSRPSEAVDPAVHTPARIGAYLKAHGWFVTTPGVLASFWGHPEHSGRSDLLLVPASTRGSDYTKRVGEVATDLAGLYGVGELQVLADIEAAA